MTAHLPARRVARSRRLAAGLALAGALGVAACGTGAGSPEPEPEAGRGGAATSHAAPTATVAPAQACTAVADWLVAAEATEDAVRSALLDPLSSATGPDVAAAAALVAEAASAAAARTGDLRARLAPLLAAQPDLAAALDGVLARTQGSLGQSAARLAGLVDPPPGEAAAIGAGVDLLTAEDALTAELAAALSDPRLDGQQCDRARAEAARD